MIHPCLFWHLLRWGQVGTNQRFRTICVRSSPLYFHLVPRKPFSVPNLLFHLSSLTAQAARSIQFGRSPIATSVRSNMCLLSLPQVLGLLLVILCFSNVFFVLWETSQGITRAPAFFISPAVVGITMVILPLFCCMWPSLATWGVAAGGGHSVPHVSQYLWAQRQLMGAEGWRPTLCDFLGVTRKGGVTVSYSRSPPSLLARL